MSETKEAACPHCGARLAVRFEQIVEELHVELIVLDDHYGTCGSPGIRVTSLDARSRFLVVHRHRLEDTELWRCAPILGRSLPGSVPTKP